MNLTRTHDGSRMRPRGARFDWTAAGNGLSITHKIYGCRLTYLITLVGRYVIYVVGSGQYCSTVWVVMQTGFALGRRTVRYRTHDIRVERHIVG